MTHSSRWLLVLSVSALVGVGVTNLYAQDELDALLKEIDLGGGDKPAEVAKPAEAAKPADEAKPAEAEKPADEAKPAEAEKPADEKPAEAEKPAAEPAAAEPAVAAQPAAEPVDDAAALISELETLERIRRKSLDDHGYSALEEARQLMLEKDYENAAKKYKQALEFIVDRPANADARQEATEGQGNAYYEEAKRLMKLGEKDKAIVAASKAKDNGHPQADRLLETLKREPDKAEKLDSTQIKHRVNDKDYKTSRDEIRRRLRRSRQYFTTGELEKALEECELILRDYPTNVEAMQMRDRVADRMKSVSDIEFEATRSKMIRDVRDTWNDKRYAINSPQLPRSKNELTTKRDSADIIGGRTAEQVVRQKLVDIVIPEVSFRPPATIIDAVDFFKVASRDFDKQEIPVEQRGVNLVLKLPGNAGATAEAAPAADGAADPFASADTASTASSGVPVIPAMTARFINLYDALKLVCDVTGMKFRIRGNIVMIVPVNEPDSELITRSYNVLASLTDRISAAQSEMQTTRSNSDSGLMDTADMGQTQDWKAFFESMGVTWPEGSSIAYISTIGKLRVKNTAEQLAVFEQVLEDLNVTPRMIEIEARFVEVSQRDLNSLGFEWLLNSDFSFDAGGFLDKALNLKEHSNTLATYTDANGVSHPYYLPYTKPGRMTGVPIYNQTWNSDLNNGAGGMENVATGNYRMNDGSVVDAATFQALNGQYGNKAARRHNASISQVDGTTYSNGQRFLSTEGNPAVPEGSSVNDQFMKVNALFGNADISMILHMLSQRSDTDVLSAPKVVTKNGQEAVMKVVTEYIYPTEFEVEISQQSNSSSYNGGSSGMTLATVEPQNFETREVGVILQVVPEVSPEGQMINLMLNPQVVSEPTWKNYGMKIPYFKPSNNLTSLAGLSDAAVSAVMGQQTADDIQYMELPMEQPFFSVRSVSTQLSVYNGATVVMGGLITENRTTIEDKIPFLGDIPYLGRFFRSKAESSEKRNLLVFVTARLVDLDGRVIKPT
ncbi:MAG: hypothetical protein J6U40_08535, partial [Kiritimatiellae bacterium]|nr:hypothetical protein [Kiritimatiellia bacterium]